MKEKLIKAKLEFDWSEDANPNWAAFLAAVRAARLRASPAQLERLKLTQPDMLKTESTSGPFNAPTGWGEWARCFKHATSGGECPPEEKSTA